MRWEPDIRVLRGPNLLDFPIAWPGCDYDDSESAIVGT